MTQLRRCGVRLSLRGEGDDRPRTERFAAAPAIRRPTGRQTDASPSRDTGRCCDDERWAAAQAPAETSPAPCQAMTAPAGVAEAAAMTSSAAVSLTR